MDRNPPPFRSRYTGRTVRSFLPIAVIYFLAGMLDGLISPRNPPNLQKPRRPRLF